MQEATAYLFHLGTGRVGFVVLLHALAQATEALEQRTGKTALGPQLVVTPEKRGLPYDLDGA
jgi:hypothetical protein